MTEIMSKEFSRKSFVKGGGALIVGFSIAGGSHAGFAAIADGFPLRLLGNPDRLGCAALMRNLADVEPDPAQGPFAKLGGAEDGIVLDSGTPLPCRNGTPGEALAAGRQLMITRLAALAFFESRFAKDGAERASQESFLHETLARDFPEASFVAAGG